ncbi:MAG: M14 family zinc carboxypeptidase [Ignavibacteriota bacterium]
MNNSIKIILVLFFIISCHSFAQKEINIVNGAAVEFDKCGYAIDGSGLDQYISPEYMGYSYDSLLLDLELWRTSEYVKIDSIGLSVQGRPLWQLTISGNPNNVAGKRTVHIHARTHPQETEGFYVTEKIIEILTSESILAQTVRANCVFYIIPMYNPDGVELAHTRTNANNVDLEANWNTFPHQPEVAALKARFIELMASPNPIEVMLNMHSSSLCERYFVYHHENGTSTSYALKEQNFIDGVRNYFPGGIEPYTYFVSWASGTALQYPESWCWINHGENIMAITYEDMYQCSGTGNFDSTANAIVHGVMDYMNIATDVEQAAEELPTGFELYQNYPNPFNPSTIIKYTIPKVTLDLSSRAETRDEGSRTILKIYDVLGNEVATLVNEYKPAGNYEVEFNVGRDSRPDIASGVYFYRLQAGSFAQTKKMILLK